MTAPNLGQGMTGNQQLPASGQPNGVGQVPNTQQMMQPVQQGQTFFGMPPGMFQQPQIQQPQMPVQQFQGQQQMQPQQQQQYVQQPQMQQPVAQPQPQGIQVGQDGRLYNTGVPELEGRTLPEAQQIYAGMRQTTQQMAQQQFQQPRVQAPTPQFQPQQQASPQLQQQQSGGINNDTFWEKPLEAFDQLMDRKLQQAMQPILQNTLLQQVEGVRRSMLNIPDYLQYEGQVMQILSNVPQEALTNPTVWQDAYILVKGRAQLQGGQQNQRPSQQLQQPPQHQYVQPNQQQPQFNQPLVPSFFTEGPTAPQPQAQPNQQQATPEDIENARRQGVPLDQWMFWKGKQTRG